MLASPAALFGRFRNRVLAPHLLIQQTVLSAAELSSLYHIPDPASQPEDLLAHRHPDLPVPLSVKQLDGQFDVVLGRGSDGQPVGLTLEQRQKHTYLIGKTGMGKTTLLMHSIVQDMVNGKGLCVLDPHGDMFHELLGLVPPHRLKDVVVFDPADREWPVSLNLLDPGIDFTSMDEQEDRITSAVIAVFARLAEENQWGPRMEHVLRNATMTALRQPSPNLFTLQRILTDSKFQKQALKYIHDPVLLQFWQKEWKRNGDMQLASMTAPLTHRLGHFITAKMSRNILLQGESTLRIGDIMNEGKILLVNLSKGELGEDQSRFFGTLLTAFIWLAAYQRTTIPEAKRRDFFLYVDEFQNFATPDFASIVSEGRKYHLSLVVSHQSISQIKDKDLVRQLAGNASTLISLKVSPEDEHFLLPYMKPELRDGAMINLPPHQFYAKTTSEVSEHAFSGSTVPLTQKTLRNTAQAVLDRSRHLYAVHRTDAEAQLGTTLADDKQKTLQSPTMLDDVSVGPIPISGNGYQR